MGQKDQSIQPSIKERSQEEAIQDFLLDIGCLDELDQWVSKINFFDILKIGAAEIRHSNILAWLLDPAENHGLQDTFIRGVVHHLVERHRTYFSNNDIDVLQLLTLNYSHFTVQREWNHIDILLHSKEDQLVICFENKIRSTEHDNQLKNYQNTLLNAFPKSQGFVHLLVYLTPDGASPSDIDNWITYGYSDILKLIERIIDMNVAKNEVAMILSNYVDTLRRYIVKDERLAEICLKIYNKHREALDLIYENRPDLTSEIAGMIRDYLQKRSTKDPRILFDVNRCVKTLQRFSTLTMNGLLPPVLEDQNSFWGGGVNYFWEIRSIADNKKLRISFATCNFEQLNGERVTKLATIVNKQLKDKWLWKTFMSVDYEIESDDYIIEPSEENKRRMASSIHNKLDYALEKVFEFEKKILEKW